MNSIIRIAGIICLPAWIIIFSPLLQAAAENETIPGSTANPSVRSEVKSSGLWLDGCGETQPDCRLGVVQYNIEPGGFASLNFSDTVLFLDNSGAAYGPETDGMDFNPGGRLPAWEGKACFQDEGGALSPGNGRVLHREETPPGLLL